MKLLVIALWVGTLGLMGMLVLGVWGVRRTLRVYMQRVNAVVAMLDLHEKKHAEHDEWHANAEAGMVSLGDEINGRMSRHDQQHAHHAAQHVLHNLEGGHTSPTLTWPRT